MPPRHRQCVVFRHRYPAGVNGVLRNVNGMRLPDGADDRGDDDDESPAHTNSSTRSVRDGATLSSSFILCSLNIDANWLERARRRNLSPPWSCCAGLTLLSVRMSKNRITSGAEGKLPFLDSRPVRWFVSGSHAGSSEIPHVNESPSEMEGLFVFWVNAPSSLHSKLHGRNYETCHRHRAGRGRGQHA